MTEVRCPDCEALLTELDCLECVWHKQHQNAVRVMDQRLADLPPPARTHCAKGHEMTEANTRIEVRVEGKKSITRVCKACRNDRMAAQRERRKTTQPREPGKLDRGRVAPTGRMTSQTLPAEEQT